MNDNAKVKALKKIRTALEIEHCPLAQSCGITEEEFLALTEPEDPLIEVYHTDNANNSLEAHRVNDINPKGKAMLANAPAESKWPERRWNLAQAIIVAIVSSGLTLLGVYMAHKLGWK